VLLPDGTVRWIASTARLRLGPGGEPLELIGVSVDITQRRAEEAERAVLYAERDRAVNLLRRSLLPAALPEIPCVSLGAWYQPWTAGLDVGGDFYDVVRAGEHWWLVLGDVCGKGAAAAAVGASARYALRALLLDHTDPAAVLTRLNAVLYPSNVDGDFLTVVLLRVTPSTGAGDPVRARVRVATGGHPAPLLRRADGTVTAVPVRGTVLGLLPEVRIGQSDVDLLAGDALLLHTDGLTDATDAAGGQLGDETVRALLAATAPAGAGQPFVDALASAFVAAAARIRDDVAVLGLLAHQPHGS
jgi:phosphoserine phosphatase RsbU/P